jgi:hypothetical protein
LDVGRRGRAESKWRWAARIANELREGAGEKAGEKVDEKFRSKCREGNEQYSYPWASC